MNSASLNQRVPVPPAPAPVLQDVVQAEQAGNASPAGARNVAVAGAAPEAVGAPAGRLVARMMTLVGLWLTRMRDRRELRHLMELDDRMLRDVGVHRWQVEAYARRWFWQV